MNTEIREQWELNLFNVFFLESPGKHKPIEDEDNNDNDKPGKFDDNDIEVDDDEKFDLEDDDSSDDGDDFDGGDGYD